MNRVFITHHGLERFKNRWPNKECDPYSIIQRAWISGRLPDEKETERLFWMGRNRAGKWMLDYRIFDGHVFVFENQGRNLRFVTVFKNKLNSKSN